MRLRLEDQGEGWFWGGASLEVEVLEEVRVHSRRFCRVLFPEPVEGHESCTRAWLSPRWVGHEIQSSHSIVALLWMIPDGQQSTTPPADVDHSARVRCVAVG